MRKLDGAETWQLKENYYKAEIERLRAVLRRMTVDPEVNQRAALYAARRPLSRLQIAVVRTI